MEERAIRCCQGWQILEVVLIVPLIGVTPALILSDVAPILNPDVIYSPLFPRVVSPLPLFYSDFDLRVR